MWLSVQQSSTTRIHRWGRAGHQQQPLIPPGDYEMDVRVPLNYVARGVFYVDISFATMMFGGGNRILDIVNKAFKIEVTGRSFWRINARGYFRLPESSIERLSSLL